MIHRQWSHYNIYKLSRVERWSYRQVDTKRDLEERKDYALSAQLLVNLHTMGKSGHLVCVYS